ncbi:MAG: hypothetical protein ABJH07_09285 [Sedimentitalea sp.]|uniref:hypothetical protein n=1 Tax=Sedimentitalea sp. TaxID=2048915 RepID=UPI0032676F1D
MKRGLPGAIAELQAANVSPADMPRSAIGTGMGIFSRYAGILEPDDSQMCVKTTLQLINAELDDFLGGIQGEFDADTRFAISWFEQNGVKAGEFGTANSIATARGISVDSVIHAGIVDSQAGKVRILKRSELDPEWEPQTDIGAVTALFRCNGRPWMRCAVKPMVRTLSRYWCCWWISTAIILANASHWILTPCSRRVC